MKIALFSLFLLLGLALGSPVAPEQPKEEVKSVEAQAEDAPEDDLKTDATFWGHHHHYYRPYYYRSYYKPWSYGGYPYYGYGYHGYPYHYDSHYWR